MLRYHGEWGVEAQIFGDGKFIMGYRLNSKAEAVAWAEEQLELETLLPSTCGFRAERLRAPTGVQGARKNDAGDLSRSHRSAASPFQWCELSQVATPAIRLKILPASSAAAIRTLGP